MIIHGINNDRQTVVVEYEYGAKLGDRVIEITARVVESDQNVEPITGTVVIPGSINRKMHHWPQDRIDAAVQRLVEYKIVQIIDGRSEFGIKGYDVWLKSKQAKLHIGQHCNGFYRYCHERDIYVYREAM